MSASEDRTPEIEAALAAIRGGDVSAHARLFELALPKLGRFCFYLTGRRELAEELCQDCLVRIYENLPSLKDEKAFWPWVFRLTRNQFYDQQEKKSATQERVSDDFASLIEGQVDPTTMDELLQVKETAARLTPEDRMVILMVHLEGYSYKELSEITGDSEEALRIRAHRARKEFIKKLDAA